MSPNEYLETARGIALDTIADNLADALTSAARGAPNTAQDLIGQAAADILDLQNIVHQQENENG